ncbi:AAA family ATPase [Streptomyces sp. NPDC059881]|uniref:AAA family ATPase n=1 Tax=Streptomyces sp. NPDC059881 TaxID=3346986 RepID=UPI00366931C7
MSRHVRVDRASWAFGQGAPQLGRGAGATARWVADWASLKLNPRQRQAVEQALAGKVLFLWGPPGTGKSEVVGHIVEGCYRQGHSVFLAPAKVAMDQALERICELLSGESGFDSGRVQRAGDPRMSCPPGADHHHTRPAQQGDPPTTRMKALAVIPARGRDRRGTRGAVAGVPSLDSVPIQRKGAGG